MSAGETPRAVVVRCATTPITCRGELAERERYWRRTMVANYLARFWPPRRGLTPNPLEMWVREEVTDAQAAAWLAELTLGVAALRDAGCPLLLVREPTTGRPRVVYLGTVDPGGQLRIGEAVEL